MRSRICFYLTLCCISVLVACSDRFEPATPRSVREGRPPAAALTVARDRHKGEAHPRELAAIAPDFAGVYKSGEDEFTILMTSQNGGRAAEARLRQIFARSGRRTPGLLRIRFATARYSFNQLSAWRDSLSERLPGFHGWTMLGINHSSNLIEIRVRQDANQGELQQILRDIGVPVAAFWIGLSEGPTLNTDPSLFDRMRPLRAGVQFGPGGCTLGPLALWGNTPIALINSHCSPGFWQQDGVQNWMSQPDTGTAHWAWEIFDWQGAACGWFWANRCRSAEVAAFFLTGVDVLPGEAGAFAVGQIARTTNRLAGTSGAFGSRTIDPNNPLHIDGVAEYPFQGEIVDKIGTGTGWTFGQVLNPCTDWNWDDSWHGKTLYCQAITEYNSHPGDSGAPVFIYNGGSSVTLLGINWGNVNGSSGYPIFHTGAFSPIGGIRDDMSSAFLSFTQPNQGPTYSVSIQGPSEKHPSATCQWSFSTNVDSPSVEWSVNNSPVYWDAIYTSSATASFTLGLSVWNTQQGSWASTSISVTVSEQSGYCAIQ